METIKKGITPGQNMIRTISAFSGGNAEKLIRSIAKENKYGIFGDWENEGTVLVSKGTIQYDEKIFQVTLKIGVQEELFLRDIGNDQKKSVSMKNIETTGNFILEVPSGLNGNSLYQAVKQIVGCWIIHGKNWTNRSKQVCNWPYGHDQYRPMDYSFSVVDGGVENLSLDDLVTLGTVRVTHTGQWNRPYVLAGALAGMKIIAREFRASGKDVCTFRDKFISPDVNIWGGYATWDESVQKSIDSEFFEIAQKSASPFAFHLHATKLRFPNYSLMSTFLIDQIEKEKLDKLVAEIVVHEPRRLYRLIDEKGRTHKLLIVRKNREKLIFEDNYEFSIPDAVENVLHTFRELREIEFNPGFILPRRKRLVLDPHFYLIVQALAFGFDGVARELSGGDTYRHLVQAEDIKMKQKQMMYNQRILNLVEKISPEVKKFEFHIYPSVGYQNPLENQYTTSSIRFSG